MGGGEIYSYITACHELLNGSLVSPSCLMASLSVLSPLSASIHASLSEKGCVNRYFDE